MQSRISVIGHATEDEVILSVNVYAFAKIKLDMDMDIWWSTSTASVQDYYKSCVANVNYLDIYTVVLLYESAITLSHWEQTITIAQLLFEMNLNYVFNYLWLMNGEPE